MELLHNENKKRTEPNAQAPSPKGKERLEIRKGFDAPKKGKCTSQDLKKGKVFIRFI